MTTDPSVDTPDERELAARLTNTWAVRVDGAAVNRSRAQALTTYGAAGRRVHLRWRRAGAAAVAGLVLGALTVAVTMPTALPGHPAYGLKQFVEAVRVELAQSPDGQASAWLGIAEARLEEAVRAEATDRLELMPGILSGYVDAVDQARSHGAEARDPETAKELQTGLRTHEEVLRGLLTTAPEAARAGLERALNAGRVPAEAPPTAPVPPWRPGQEPPPDRGRQSGMGVLPDGSAPGSGGPPLGVPADPTGTSGPPRVQVPGR